jgi:biopolymer transport protein ExbD
MALIQIRRETFVPPKLQITAMMDMFTIILFFLLFSFSDKPQEINLDPDLSLPSSIAQKSVENTVKLFLSQNKLKIDETVIAELKDGQIIGFNADKPEESTLYKSLKAQFLLIQKNKLVSQQGVSIDGKEIMEKKEQPHLLFFCDRDITFKTINQITMTAAMAGFPNFQFAVLEE